MLLQTKPTLSFILVCITIITISLSDINDAASQPRSHTKRPQKTKDAIKNDIARYKRIINHLNRLKNSKNVGPRRKGAEQIDGVEIGGGDDDYTTAKSEREEPLKSTIEGSIKLPLYAAADYEMGQYLVDIEMGTPPQKLRMVIDVGSDLTWVKCKNMPPGRFSHERGFEAAKSSSFHTIPCSTTFCKDDFVILTALDVCPTVNSPCMYNFSYGESSEDLRTYGMFGKETITLHTTKMKTAKLEKILIGCSESYSGRKKMENVDGILGLGVNPFSLAVQAVTKFGGIFSYCLVDHLSATSLSSYFIFGDDKIQSPTTEFMRYTTLRVIDTTPFLWVSIKGITVGSKMLDIPPILWREETGGTIIDSGTAVTYLNGDAYRAVMNSLVPTLAKDYPKHPDYKGDGVSDFEYCFNSSAKPFKLSNVPRLEIHFNDGARFVPHIKSYIIDDGPDVKCVGFLQAQGGLNILGNIMQQNYLWEFDLQRETVGFTPSTCR